MSDIEMLPAHYVYTQIQCAICNQELDITSPGLHFLTSLIYAHENDELHKKVIAEMESKLSDGLIGCNEVIQDTDDDASENEGSSSDQSSHSSSYSYIELHGLHSGRKRYVSVAKDKLFDHGLENEGRNEEAQPSSSRKAKSVARKPNYFYMPNTCSERKLIADIASQNGHPPCILLSSDEEVEPSTINKSIAIVSTSSSLCKPNTYVEKKTEVPESSDKQALTTTSCDISFTHPPGHATENGHNESSQHRINMTLGERQNETNVAFNDILCNICNLLVPPNCLYNHIYSSNHMDRLLDKFPDVMNSIIIEKPGSLGSWCKLCEIWLPTRDNVKHSCRDQHLRRGMAKSTQKWHVFEYNGRKIGLEINEFSCILCSALNGRCTVEESQTTEHSTENTHMCLVDARLTAQRELNIENNGATSAVFAPSWQCWLCSKIFPMTITIAHHVLTASHRELLAKHVGEAVNDSEAAETIRPEPNSVSNEATDEEQHRSVRNDVTDRPNLKKIQNLIYVSLPPPTDEVHLEEGFCCLVCNLISTDIAGIETHVKSDQHIHCVNMFHKIWLLKSDYLRYDECLKLMLDMIRKAERMGRGHKLWPECSMSKENKRVYCPICDKTMDGPYQAVTHSMWKIHRQRLDALRNDWLTSVKIRRISDNNFVCEVCDCGRLIAWSQVVVHEKSIYHRELRELVEMSYPDAIVKVFERMKESEAEHYDPKHLTDCGEMLYCHVCQQCLYSPSAAFKHVEERAHLEKVKIWKTDT